MDIINENQYKIHHMKGFGPTGKKTPQSNNYLDK